MFLKKNDKCPSCGFAFDKLSQSMGLEKLETPWYKFQKREPKFTCIECNANLRYSDPKLPGLIGVISFSFFICFWLYRLVDTENSNNIQIGIAGTIALVTGFIAMHYYHRNRKLIVK